MPAFSGLFDTIQPTGHTLLDTKPSERQLARMFRAAGNRKIRELALTLNGAAAGDAANASYKRVEHVPDAGEPVVSGGVRTVEDVSVLDRNTAADDETRIDEFLEDSTQPTTYPVDLSGNGGGGKQNEFA